MLERSDLVKNQYVYISSFHFCQNDILEVLEGINDGEEWIVRHVTSEEIIEQGRKRLADGDTMGAIDLVGGEALEREALGDSRPWGIWDEKLGIPRGIWRRRLGKRLIELGSS